MYCTVSQRVHLLADALHIIDGKVLIMLYIQYIANLYYFIGYGAWGGVQVRVEVFGNTYSCTRTYVRTYIQCGGGGGEIFIRTVFCTPVLYYHNSQRRTYKLMF